MTDPFGTAVLDFLDGNPALEIGVSSSFDEDETISVPYLFRTWEEMPEKEKFALSLCKGKILDAGAGAGAHSLTLQQQAKNVTALDRSEKCCEAMRRRGVQKVICKDFFQLDETEKFDSLLFLMNGFGITGTLENLEQFFLKCKALLKPGGRLIGESTDILYMFEDEEGAYRIDLNTAYYGEVQYRMSYKEEQTEEFPWLYVSMDLLTEAAEKVGFTVLDFFEEGDSYVVCLE